ncbi:MAG: hypothetical protein PHX82_07400 [Paracoccaceae bacterium]|nr:hypothetical protein [Paracoccaceae bacterium]
MKRAVTLATALALCAGFAQAQTQPFVPGEDFMLQWDLDGDGKVTLAEAREQRENIFLMFDQDGDGRFSDDELAGIDEHKSMQREIGMGPGHNLPNGVVPPAGRGPGQGNGMGQGMGPGKGVGQRPMNPLTGLDMPAAEGMRMFDANGDGTVTEPEFVTGTDGWFAMRDRNGDGVLTTADFGRP